MARIVPNENSWVGFATSIVTKQSPTVAEVNAAADLTPWLISINASSTGNTVPTPALNTLFETSVPGTSTATFSADFYRDTAADTAWTTLPRAQAGFFIISRFGGGGALDKPSTIGNKVEIWPVVVTSRTSSNMSSNQAMTFTITCSVSIEPAEAAVVIA